MSAWWLTLLIGTTLHHGCDNGIKAHAGVPLTHFLTRTKVAVIFIS